MCMLQNRERCIEFDSYVKMTKFVLTQLCNWVFQVRSVDCYGCYLHSQVKITEWFIHQKLGVGPNLVQALRTFTYELKFFYNLSNFFFKSLAFV